MPDTGHYTDSISLINIELCALCGDREVFDKAYGPAMGLCCGCAEQAANLWSLAHCGEPIFGRTFKSLIRKPLPAKVRWSVLRRDGFTCQSCGAADRPMHVDHVVAVANGGADDPENLQTLCDRCNMQKGAR
jgi:hypothetical protein